ncbi:MAG: S1C family serine protease [Nitrospinales bacterium]
MSKNTLFILMLTAIHLCCFSSVSFANEDIQSSMIKIYTSQNNPSYINQWDSDGPDSISGSGVVIAGNRILTNAHVVTNGTFIQVRAHGKAERFRAKVAAVSHEADLALLTVEEPSFFDGLNAIELGDVPPAQEPIAVFGFPTGGDTLSMTTGIVSRIEHQFYVHSYMELFAIQVDAAINAGNSGGPAISGDGKIIGVSMQGNDEAENIAYLIPTPVIRHFIKDVADGTYDGFPTLGISTQKMENQALKERLGLKKQVSGILVKNIVPGCTSDGYLKKGDVILRIDKFDLANDKTIEFRSNERTSYKYCIERKQINETINIRILRNNENLTLKVPLTSRLGEERLINYEYDKSPAYFIYGGLVFCPLTMNYLTGWGDDWRYYVPDDLGIYLYNNWKRQKKDQIVIISKVLPTESNVGYHELEDVIIRSVNGTKISHMDGLVAAVNNSNGQKYMEFITSSNERIVIDIARAAEEEEELLEIYGIESNLQ